MPVFFRKNVLLWPVGALVSTGRRMPPMPIRMVNFLTRWEWGVQHGDDVCSHLSFKQFIDLIWSIFYERRCHRHNIHNHWAEGINRWEASDRDRTDSLRLKGKASPVVYTPSCNMAAYNRMAFRDTCISQCELFGEICKMNRQQRWRLSWRTDNSPVEEMVFAFIRKACITTI